MAWRNKTDTAVRGLTLVLMLCLVLGTVGCVREAPGSEPGTGTQSCVVNGREIAFVDDAAKQAWQEPLERLLSNVLVAYGENGDILGYEASVDPHAPSIPQCYRCGLFDVTRDGVPELLVHPFGYFGSSGSVTYFVYDFYSGQKLGEISGGISQSWCVYYDIVEEKADIYGQFWIRIGWSWRERYVKTLYFDEAIRECGDVQYLRSTHDITAEEVEGEENAMIERYPATNYYMYQSEVGLDEYYQAYDTFLQTCIRIPETELILFDWGDVSDDADDYPTKGKKMAAALIASAQEYVDFAALEAVQ